MSLVLYHIIDGPFEVSFDYKGELTLSEDPKSHKLTWNILNMYLHIW